MRQLLVIFVTILLLPRLSFSQVYIEPITGYQFDINKTNSKLFNTGIQLALKKRKMEFLLQIQKSWQQKNATNIDSSFTANTNLPLNAPALKTIKPSIFSAGIGNRIKLFGKKTNNSFFATWGFGVMHQKNTVIYNYDKANYIVLNPEQTKAQTGVYISAGVEYMRQLKTGRIFFNVNASSPPIFNPISRYDKFAAPLSLNIGYSIRLSKLK